MRLWVDDLRKPPGVGWVWAQTSQAAIAALLENAVVEMSLDHDLGGEDTTRPVVLWLCENPVHWPNEVRVHSMNVVGRSWLTAMVYRYNPHMEGFY